MKKFNNFYDAWWYLCEHPDFNDTDNYHYSFQQCLDIYVTKVNPKTNLVDENKELNTHTEVWLECGKFIEKDENFPNGIFEHDINLDCGGSTFEEAIINLANLVKKYY